MRNKLILVPNLFLIAFLTVPRIAGSNEVQPWQDRLNTPTQVTKVGGLYFIVVCFHHRILYSDRLDRPIPEWKVLDAEIAGPHSIDSDGTLYVAEDTGRHQLKVYLRKGDSFFLVQTLGPFGRRTHRVRYDKPTRAFYVLSSNSQDLTKLVREGDRLKVVYTKPMTFLEGAYTRSISIFGEAMYFSSGPGVISKVRYRDDSYERIATYRMPEGMESGGDIFRTRDGWWYLTATPRRLVRARSLERLDAGDYEDVYETFGLRGTPYYLADFDGRYFLPQISPYSGLKSFVHDSGGNITDIRTHFDFGPPNPSDADRMGALPR